MIGYTSLRIYVFTLFPVYSFVSALLCLSPLLAHLCTHVLTRLMYSCIASYVFCALRISFFVCLVAHSCKWSVYVWIHWFLYVRIHSMHYLFLFAFSLAYLYMQFFIHIFLYLLRCESMHLFTCMIVFAFFPSCASLWMLSLTCACFVYTFIYWCVYFVVCL